MTKLSERLEALAEKAKLREDRGSARAAVSQVHILVWANLPTIIEALKAKDL